MNQVEQFLKQLRESADLMYKIFTEGSCFRLYRILETIFPRAVPYWSDRDGHCVIKIEDAFYDIGGRVNPQYVDSMDYYQMSPSKFDGYDLLKWSPDPDHRPTIATEKYITREG